MGDAPPVIVPTAVFEPFDFGDEPFGDHDAIASVLDDPGRMLGVERDAEARLESRARGVRQGVALGVRRAVRRGGRGGESRGG